MQGLVKTLSVPFCGSLKSPKAQHPSLAATQGLQRVSNPPRKILLPPPPSVYTFLATSSFHFSKGRSPLRKPHSFFATGCFLGPTFLWGKLLMVSFHRVWPHCCCSRAEGLSLSCLPLPSMEMEEQLSSKEFWLGTHLMLVFLFFYFFFARVGDMRANFLRRKRVKPMFMGAQGWEPVNSGKKKQSTAASRLVLAAF